MIAVLAAASMAGGAFVPGQNVRVITGEQASQQGSGTLNRTAGQSGGMLASIFGGGASGYRTPGLSYRNRFPVSVAQGKRDARKRRNVQRARGQHRKAVR